MPKPISPVVPGFEPHELIYGKDQPEYIPLPALRGRGPCYSVMSRWQLSDRERELIAKGADVYTTQMTFANDFQPTNVIIASADDMGALKDIVDQQFGFDEELDERIRNS